jgi:predicted ester cyclase
MEATLDHHKAMARRLYEEVFGRGNVDAADEILSTDCLSHGPGMPAAVGTSGIKAQAIRLRAGAPDLAVSLEDQVAEGDRVVSRWHATGTQDGPMALSAGTQLPPTGRRFEFDEIRIDRFSSGRIVESWFIPDRLSVMLQLTSS